jgi:hypothetical protein
MIALIPPGLLLGLLLSVGYACLFHVWGGYSLRDLFFFLIASVCGFAIGQLLGMLMQLPLPQIGQIHIVEASVVACLALIGVREFSIERRK